MAPLQGGGSGGGAMRSIDDGEDVPALRSGPAGPPSSGRRKGTEDLPATLTLALDDLLPGIDGEIVIVIVGGDRDSRLSIVTDQRVCDSGVIADHVTADGYDVGGLSYCAFESGTRLYYSESLALTIAQADAC